MNIEFTKKQLIFLLEMVNTLNFPGREVENVFEIKNKIKKTIDEIPEIDENINPIEK